ncbi:Beta-amylase 1, chloroplastic [Vitis vinifera]|uniref:Beta-amylase n=1 Tax=Vitis vinifera TaxID=29760 RepID=A0A438IJK5_VITVI|nr:Beta-amylase 1, chloroplastic [Vitis vinifera]
METEATPAEREYKEGGCKGYGEGRCPVYVMIPLDSVTMGNGVNTWEKMKERMQKLKSAGVEGVMMDVWWGLWRGRPLAPIIGVATRSSWRWPSSMGLKFRRSCPSINVVETSVTPARATNAPIIQCHRMDLVDVGQLLGIPLPNWGRTPVQCYADFMRAFRDNFKHLLEIQVGMGPSGELRYPSYPEQNGTWKFPGIGAFQCYDKYMLSSLKAAAEAAGKPKWGSTGPTDAGHYNNWPEDTQFFRREGGGWTSPYGHGVKISVKVSGIHWHYGTRSHAPELTAGYYNTRFRDGYIPIAQMLARHGAILNFTCIEMRDHEQPQDARCAPEKLVRQVALATRKAQVPLAGENALPRYDETAHEQILRASSLNFDGEEREMCAFTYLRMNPDLFQADNWRRFVAFVKKMKEGKNAH